MLKHVLWRLAQFPLILAVIYLATFLLVWVAPGTPFESTDRQQDPQVMKALKVQYNCENSWQFLSHYPAQLLRGDLGPSFYYKGRSVNEIMADALPVSVTLGIFALTLALLGGVSVGILAAVRRGGLFDWLGFGLGLVGISLPTFVVAGALQLLFSVIKQWFPAGQWSSPRDMILPGVALSLMPMAYIARLMRVSMIDVLSSDYVRTARAKGLSRAKVVWGHCFRNAFLPVLSYLGPAAASVLTGSFVVEKVFGLPGLGQYMVNSVLNRDQTMILGTVLVYSIFLLSFNLLVDLAYTWVDPRISMEAVTE